ncbi:MAG TPA: OmpA family protein [Kofleriaceae bacterium]|nr:OmpA family protein [Kofleriaceae bacterium]
MLRASIGASLLTFSLLACGSPVVFQGERALKITGTPPVAAAPAPAAAAPPRVEVRDNRIVINEKIQFEYDKATIVAVSFDLLNEVTAVIQKNPHIKKIQIEGHASAEGSAGHNRKLSDDRARAVMRYVVDHGVPQERLSARGFGSDRPIADNDTPAGREQNRRVEFNIIEQDVTQRRVEIGKDGKERVLEEKPLASPTASANSSRSAP